MQSFSVFLGSAVLLACALPLPADPAYRPASHSASTPDASQADPDPAPSFDVKASPTAQPTKADLADQALRSEYRLFSRRLREVDRLIRKAERDGNATAEEAVQHHADVALIRVQFKLNADKSAQAMSPSEKSKMEYEIKVQEKSARELNQE
jgi:hypothetical protein